MKRIADNELRRLHDLEGNSFSEQVDADVSRVLIEEVLALRSHCRVVVEVGECGCRACDRDRELAVQHEHAAGTRLASDYALNSFRFVVCDFCGNKRCPRASDHNNACTNSNEPGQSRSVYA